MTTLTQTKALGIASTNRRWVGWTPLFALTAMAGTLRGHLLPWAVMWILAIAIFAGFKWWTWYRAMGAGVQTTAARSFTYLLLWPGMDARKFLPSGHTVGRPSLKEWQWAFAKTVFGAILVWGVARLAGDGLTAGWIGMVGLIFLLHFGVFALLALFWQWNGIDAQPLMNCPIAATSLSDFWGRRWNSGFRDIVFGIFFVRIAKRFGTAWGTIVVFLISGLIHDLVITFPAGGGYGLPTLYFTFQGVAMLIERSTIGDRLGLAIGWRGRAFALLVVASPIAALFPPPFVLNVMVPFFQLLKALP